MALTLSIREARDRLSQLPGRLVDGGEPQTCTVTRRGEPVLVILPYDLHEAIAETLEIFGDEEQMKALRAGIRALQSDDTVAWEDVRRELEL